MPAMTLISFVTIWLTASANEYHSAHRALIVPKKLAVAAPEHDAIDGVALRFWDEGATHYR
jgi:hypothetical protein